MSREFSPVQLGSIQLFCKAAELESFKGAAEAFGITPAAVSRSVQRIEKRLGVRLFARSTRQIRLTAEGRIYYENCQAALAQIDEVEQTLSGGGQQPTGILKISVPTTYGHYRVLPLLSEFAERYPDLAIEVNISNHNIDFIEEGYDLAIRLGIPKDSRMVARKLEEAGMGVFGSPQYLRKHGTPRTLEDLRKHQCIQFALPSTGRAMPYLFQQGGNEVEFAFDSRVRCTDDVLGCVTYARHGGGLFQIYDFIAQDYAQRGELKEVLQGYRGRSRPFYLLYQQNRYMPAKLKAFVDFMLENLASQ